MLATFDTEFANCRDRNFHPFWNPCGKAPRPCHNEGMLAEFGKKGNNILCKFTGNGSQFAKSKTSF